MEVDASLRPQASGGSGGGKSRFDPRKLLAR